jgi:hypothetical protein
LTLAALTGCGSDRLAPASGVVRIAAQPACEGRIVFLPVGGGPPALGDVGSDGRFVLRTGGNQDGALVAVHHVLLKDVRRAGDAKAKSYRAAESTAFEVRRGTHNEFAIDVDLRRGWAAVADD